MLNHLICQCHDTLTVDSMGPSRGRRAISPEIVPENVPPFRKLRTPIVPTFVEQVSLSVAW